MPYFALFSSLIINPLHDCSGHIDKHFSLSNVEFSQDVSVCKLDKQRNQYRHLVGYNFGLCAFNEYVIVPESIINFCISHPLMLH